MVYYPIQTLVNAGIEEILLVTGGTQRRGVSFLAPAGKRPATFGLKHINYTYQEGEGGIAEASGGWAEYFAGNDLICVILGDNIIENNICAAVENFKKRGEGREDSVEGSDGRTALFGVAEIRGNHVIGIEEKTENLRNPITP